MKGGPLRLSGCVQVFSALYQAGSTLAVEFNGLVDTTIPIQHALSIQANYDRRDVGGRMSIVPLPHTPHGVFTQNVTTPGSAGSKTQSQVAFEWVVRDQALVVQS